MALLGDIRSEHWVCKINVFIVSPRSLALLDAPRSEQLTDRVCKINVFIVIPRSLALLGAPRSEHRFVKSMFS